MSALWKASFDDGSPKSRVYIRTVLALTPALLVILVTAFIDLVQKKPYGIHVLAWAQLEIGISALVAATGLVVLSFIEMRSARKRLEEANRAEEIRRVIAAIGVAASWDLDLNRLYERVAQDLRSIIPFDRFTITSALPTGRMKVEFVRGEDDEGPPVGSVLPERPDEPDGLHAEFKPRYGAKLTAAIPACNGTLTIRSHKANSYGQDELDLLRQAVAQISPGIANAILFQASERRVKERTVLADIGRAATSAGDPKEIVRAIDMSLARLIEYDHLGVILVDGDNPESNNSEVVYWSREGLSGWHEGDRGSFDTGEVSEQGVQTGHGSGPIGLRPASASTEAEDNERAWLQAPLIAQEKFTGVLALSSESSESFGADESALLLNISLQVAPAIQNARLAASLKRQADERRAVAAIGLAANEELMLDAIYNRVADELAKVLPFDRMSVTFFSAEDGQRTIDFVRGTAVDGFGIGDTAPTPQPHIDGQIVDNRDWSVLPPEVQVLKEQGGLKSRISARLGTEPNVLGAINIASKIENAYDQEAAEFLERVAIQITPAIRNARMIAAERELRETLDRQNQELFEANNARKQFLSTVSHELKTPLTIISGFIDLLASPDAPEDPDEKSETLGIIRRNANRLDVLINDILDISRLDAGTFKINPAPFAVNELVSDLEASFQSLMRSKTQTMHVNMPEDEVWIDADRSRIEQVITNLLSNASKYSPEETEITLSCEVDEDRLHISVADQGVGMTKEDQEKLFTAFFRVDNEATRQVAGTGLGLVIAKSITELHGGEIRLDSKPGAGTTIEFWLPGLTSRETAEQEIAEQQVIAGSRLWPDGPPPELELGAD